MRKGVPVALLLRASGCRLVEAITIPTWRERPPSCSEAVAGRNQTRIGDVTCLATRCGRLEVVDLRNLCMQFPSQFTIRIQACTCGVSQTASATTGWSPTL